MSESFWDSDINIILLKPIGYIHNANFTDEVEFMRETRQSNSFILKLQLCYSSLLYLNNSALQWGVNPVSSQLCV
jgi:hypothetical protein